MNAYGTETNVMPSVYVAMQYFRELQSLLQQFIIVEHAVDPAVDPSAVAGVDQQQDMDQAALEAMKQDSEAVAVDESAAETNVAMEPAEAVDMAMMETPAEPSAMETSSSADNQMAFEQDQQPAAGAFAPEETDPSEIA